MSSARQRKNKSASSTMDDVAFKRLAAASRETTNESSNSYSASSDAKRSSGDGIVVTRFNSTDVGFLASVSYEVAEHFNMSPSTILLPIWALVFSGLYFVTQYAFKNYQIHVMVPERTHTLSATKLVEVHTRPSPFRSAQPIFLRTFFPFHRFLSITEALFAGCLSPPTRCFAAGDSTTIPTQVPHASN